MFIQIEHLSKVNAEEAAAMPVTLADVDAWFQRWDIHVDVQASEAPGSELGRANVRLRHGRSRLSAILLYGSDVGLSAALQVLDNRPTLIATSIVNPRRAAAFRRAGLQYVDSVGNAYLRFGEVVIDVQGRPGTAPTTSKAGSPINMFTPSRAKVVCALLTWPPLWNASRREVARVAGVSVGQAHATLRSLTELGYDGAAADSGRLLDLWAAAFPVGLARHLLVDTFHGALTSTLITEQPIYVSGEGAVGSLLRPGSAVLYVRSFDVELPLRNRWRKDAQRNVTVRKAFWQEPQDDTDLTLVRTAPWPLVYVDLASSGDSRAREAASTWRDHHV